MWKPTLVSFGLALASCVPSPRAPVSPGAIAWHRFGPAAFEEARTANKLVMVDAGIEGCTACRWMHEGPYRDATVIRKVKEAFVAVSVDADQEPDLGDRFLPWGWPATIFFAPEGRQVYALQGSESAADFARLLDELVAKKRAGTLGADGESASGHGERNSNLAAACTDTKTYLDSMADDHGWGGEERVALFGPLEYAMIRGRSRGDARSSDRALAMAEGEAKLLDGVWGGIFVGAYSKTWDNPIPEKRTIFEAGALDAFSLELHRTGDAKWKTRADLVRKYLEDWMLAPDGTFYSTQQDHAPGLPANIDADAYYALGDAQRRAYGIPPIDHASYTNEIGLVIQAYVRYFEATGDEKALAIAGRAADAVLAKRLRPDGGLAQASNEFANERRLRKTTDDPTRLYLKAQGEMGLALLFLHEATGEARFVDAARKIAGALGALANDKGGFFGTTARDVDALVNRHVPFVDNVAAARFLVRLSGVTRDESYGQAAERTLAALAPRVREEGAWGAGLLALAFEESILGPLEITVVRGVDEPLAKALRAELARVYEPRKIVRLEEAGHYPAPKSGAAIYVCTRSECSSPFSNARDARGAIERMTLAIHALVRDLADTLSRATMGRAKNKSKPETSLPFASATAWEKWLAKNHATSNGIDILIAKKGSGVKSVTHQEALDVALCYGWIDAIRRSYDETYFAQRFTPRRKRSMWSKINRDKVTALIEAGRMKPAGLAEIERAKADGRWDAAYTGQKHATVPDDLQAALDASPKAKAFFETLSSQNRYSILFRLQTARKPETRAKRLATFMSMLKQRKTIYPQ